MRGGSPTFFLTDNWSLLYVNGKGNFFEETESATIGQILSMHRGYGSTFLVGGYLGVDIADAADPGKASLSIYTFTPVGVGINLGWTASSHHYLSNYAVGIGYPMAV